jgi:hypothetical protein
MNNSNLRQVLAKNGFRLEQIINTQDVGTDKPLEIQVSRHGATRLRRATVENGVITFK